MMGETLVSMTRSLLVCLRLPCIRNLTVAFRLCSANSEVSNHKAVCSYNKNNNDPIQFSVSMFHSRDSDDEACFRTGYKSCVLLYSGFQILSICVMEETLFRNTKKGKIITV